MRSDTPDIKSKLRYEGPAVLQANQLFTAELHISIGEAIATGGRIVIATRHFTDLPDVQTANPAGENSVSFSVSRPGVSLALGPSHEGGRHPWNYGFDLKVVTGELSPDDSITLVLGDPAEGSPGFRCQSFAESAFRFRLGVDPSGKGEWLVAQVADCPGFEIVGNRTVRVRPFVRDVTGESGTVSVHLKPEDVYGNISSDDVGEVALQSEEGEPLGRVRMTKGEPSAIELPALSGKRWAFVRAASDDGQVYEQSNPFGPSPVEGYHLYWGEIHAQSSLCDGTNRPDEIYAYARDAAGLDFASVSSHDFELTAGDWEAVRQATREAHEPGRFVTFLGYEWSGRNDMGGDNNVYFLDDEGPLVNSAPFGSLPGWDPAEGQVTRSLTLAQVIDELEGTQFMIVPHGGGRRCNFDYYDPGCMPLLETHSCHRNYEHLAWEAIGKGIRFGFIGGSDDHRGALGDSHPAARDWAFSSHSGLVAVYAKDLTRESLWEAFFARRVYATDGTRPVLDVRLNGALMGGELTVEVGAELELSVSTRLDGLLDRVEILRGIEVVETFGGKGNRVPEFECTYRDTASPGSVPYYVRVRQAGGGTAWSSPIWVEGHEG